LKDGRLTSHGMLNKAVTRYDAEKVTPEW
jgi:hypothetical protein